MGFLSIHTRAARLQQEDLLRRYSGCGQTVATGMSGRACVLRKNGHLQTLRWARENGCSWEILAWIDSQVP